ARIDTDGIEARRPTAWQHAASWLHLRDATLPEDAGSILIAKLKTPDCLHVLVKERRHQARPDLVAIRRHVFAVRHIELWSRLAILAQHFRFDVHVTATGLFCARRFDQAIRFPAFVDEPPPHRRRL